MKIIPAKLSQAKEINTLTLLAFRQYKEQLQDSVAVSALNETEQDVINDITNNTVLAAVRHGAIIGCIRIEKLTDDLAYIYRFAVSPEESGTGVGSSLLAYAIEECEEMGVKAIALHTNTKYFKLARYYYGKNFFVHSTTFDRGYIRALFIKELSNEPYDISAALKK
jgi:N-acetylglutamate synthase-like GNAT family acetyltransferase